MNKKQGSLIVIEGIDGSGKTTQVELLTKYLSKKNIPCEVISFPRYEENIYGGLVKRYLEGEFGSISEVNPYLMSLPFAGDRFLAKPLIEQWLNKGKVVIANRYISSSKAHLGANLPEEKREEFMGWLDELEFETNKIPKPDLTILLDVYPEIGQQNVRGEHKDIHEQDLEHLQNAYEIYLDLSKAESNWKVVGCMENGKMKDEQDIHKLVLEILDPFLLS